LSCGTKHKDPKRGPFEMLAEDDSSDLESTLFVADKPSLYCELVESGVLVTYGVDDPNGRVCKDTTLQYTTTSSGISKSISSKKHQLDQSRGRNSSAQALSQEIQDMVKDCIAKWGETMKRSDIR
jgi:hypothetical protein